MDWHEAVLLFFVGVLAGTINVLAGGAGRVHDYYALSLEGLPGGQMIRNADRHLASRMKLVAGQR